MDKINIDKINMDKINIQIPVGYEIDKEHSTSTEIVCKPIEKKVNKWEDLETVSGYYLNTYSNIHYTENEYAISYHKDIFLTEEQAKSALAFAQITQLLPHYGGHTDFRRNSRNYHIFYDNLEHKFGSTYIFDYNSELFYFKSEYEALRFIKNNEDLLRQYFMID